MKRMKKKLSLSKKVIQKLTQDELSNVVGGNAEVFTTSYGSCTGWQCCENETASLTDPEYCKKSEKPQ